MNETAEEILKKNEETEAEITIPKAISAGTPQLKTPDGYGKGVSDCGDTIEVFIILKGTEIANAGFQIYGCVNTLLAARAAAALIKNQTIAQASKLATPETIDQAAGGLPEHAKHCADLAAQAVEQALREAVISVREPWRKLYKKRF